MGNLSRTLAAGLIASMLTACGGGGGGSAPIVPKAPQSNKTAPVSMKFTFNSRTGHSLRGRKYVSRSTQGVGVSFEANNGGVALPKTESAMRAPSFATPVSGNYQGSGAGYASTNTTCTAAASDGSFSCTLLIAAPVGYDNIQITTWDQAPVTAGFGGMFDPSANDLSTNSFTNQLILSSQTNSFNYALQGVVASVNLAVNPNTLVDGAPLGQTATELLNLSAGTNVGDTMFPVNTTAGLAPGQSVTIGSGGSAETLIVASANGTSFTTTAAAANAHASNDSVTVTGILNPANLALSVLAKDADGNVIIGNDQYADADGTPVTIDVTAGSPSLGVPPAGSNPGSLTITGPTSFPNPSVQSTAISYNNGDIQSESFTASVSGTALTIPTTSATVNFTRTLESGIHVGGANLQINEFPVSAVPAGTEYIEYTWVNSTDESAAGPERSVTVSANNVIDVHVVEAPPAGATGYNVYAASVSGAETLVNSQPIPIDTLMTYHMIANGSGAPAPTAPTSVNAPATPLGQPTALAQAPSGLIGPNDIAAGPDGNIWVADQDNFVGLYTPNGKPLASYGTEGSVETVCTDSVGSMVAYSYADQTFHRITTAGSVTTLATLTTPIGLITKCTAGPDGNIWFIDNSNDLVGKVTPYGNVQTWPMLNGDQPSSITTGPDGRLWIAAAGSIQAITTGGTQSTYGYGAFNLVADPKGAQKLYYTDANSNFAEIATSGTYTVDAIPAGNSAWGLTAGPDGNLYTGANNGTADEIGRINFGTASVANPSGIVFTPFTQGLTTGAQPPRQLIVGPDNHSIWFTEASNAQIGELVLP